MLKRLLLALALVSAPAAAQQPPVADGNFVLLVTVDSAHVTQLSMGILRIRSGAAVLTQRRQMAIPCTWSDVADLPVQTTDVTPVRIPPTYGTPDQFGAYVATLYSATMVSKGEHPTPEQSTCVRGTMTGFARHAQETARSQQGT